MKRPVCTLPSGAKPLLHLSGAIGLSAMLGCGDPGSVTSERAESGSPEAFVDVAAETGLDFRYDNGNSGEFYLPEIMGGGVGVLDYDGDGDLDVYLVQGGKLGQAEPGVSGDRLFRNELTLDEEGRPRLRFTDVTEETGIDARGYGMGVATGDYDNDGHVDLYVTNFGANQLLLNNGDGTFSDVTDSTGTNDPRWSVSAAFVDIDLDGWLDLYVGNYVDMTLANNRECFDKVRDYCNPEVYSPQPDRLLRNRGDGSFEDITAFSQLARAYGNGLGVVTADFNLDGRPDLYVANDGTPNQCWMNQGAGKFKETALLAGCAVNEQGRAEAGMGVTAADFDFDGDEDLFMTHLRDETNTLYINDGHGIFRDETVRTGLGPASKSHTGFGTAWFDYDNDARLDLISANGAVNAIDALVTAGDPFPYHEPNQLFANAGDGRFEEVGTQAGRVFELSEVSRGAAFGDLDNDGDVDVVVSNNNGPVRLLLNQAAGGNHWLGLRMPGHNGRDMFGAWIEVQRPGMPALWRRVRTDGSYASASDPRILVGLGEYAGPVAVRVEWPGGGAESWTGLKTDRWITLLQGSGTPIER